MAFLKKICYWEIIWYNNRFCSSIQKIYQVNFSSRYLYFNTVLFSKRSEKSWQQLHGVGLELQIDLCYHVSPYCWSYRAPGLRLSRSEISKTHGGLRPALPPQEKWKMAWLGWAASRHMLILPPANKERGSNIIFLCF